jgi:murein DD-endopeptidase MepM/ murein hydrolase activator NlpD
MTNDQINAASLLPLRAETAAPADSDAQRQQIKRLAQEFESMLTTQMLREMRKSMLDPEDEEQGLGSDTMTDTMDIELGQALTRSGGLGLTTELLRALQRQVSSSPSGRTVTPAVPPMIPSGVVPASADVVPAAAASSMSAIGNAIPQGINGAPEDIHVPSGTVTSAFGWRRDPFTGAARFHNGVDIAMAYGRDIQAAAAGRVVFAGEQGSYGNAVVIEHPSGQQTRYAHLSAIGVQAGDEVGEGQVIGQAGATGRATGVHLHFEVVSNGRSRNPSAIDHEDAQAGG